VGRAHPDNYFRPATQDPGPAVADFDDDLVPAAALAQLDARAFDGRDARVVVSKRVRSASPPRPSLLLSALGVARQPVA